jgi:hypothetical protein
MTLLQLPTLYIAGFRGVNYKNDICFATIESTTKVKKKKCNVVGRLSKMPIFALHQNRYTGTLISFPLKFQFYMEVYKIFGIFYL